MIFLIENTCRAIRGWIYRKPHWWTDKRVTQLSMALRDILLNMLISQRGNKDCVTNRKETKEQEVCRDLISESCFRQNQIWHFRTVYSKMIICLTFRRMQSWTVPLETWSVFGITSYCPGTIELIQTYKGIYIPLLTTAGTEHKYYCILLHIWWFSTRSHLGQYIILTLLFFVMDITPVNGPLTAAKPTLI